MSTERHERGRRWRRSSRSPSALALLAAGAPARPPRRPRRARRRTSCWKHVVNDWLAHQPNVTSIYAIPCYTQAIQHLNAYPDVQAVLERDRRHPARAARRDPPGARRRRPGGGSSGGVERLAAAARAAARAAAPAARRRRTSAGPIDSLFDDLGPGNAQSIPLPLLVLGGLAALLLLLPAAARGSPGASRPAG